ncbi:hypothetical protein SLEP1_g15323 [Rubroshorea leprosula]|uniref:PGG domain-containing protein n=2 Tax=Rubroshorea leprosula TaxID=152421 RepID=A0AAV5IR98_9ROSI|nr:hypothetical protein SLEP1_g15323 [Rubroshorea leprosula]
MPVLSYVIQNYKRKLMDEYALEVIRSICGSLSELDENQFEQSGAVEASYRAIENDIPEIAIELLKNRNDNILLRRTDPEDSRNMFAHAVAHRQEKVARFLYDEFDEMMDTNMVTVTDEDGNNILHIAARLASHSQLDHISGAVLQLQNELHWFKSVEGIVPRFYNMKNKDGETPTQVFLREHRNLLKEAEKWMKKVAESCTVVGALVITTMFTVAFTVPGGNNEGTGFPIILNTTMTHPSEVSFATLFKVFGVSDAISLFAASSSVLMFLGILTSRYTCQDFHISLPKKLIIGLSSLFISIAAMMVAFCATLVIMLQGKKEVCILISLTLIASIPVTLFLLLQAHLLVEMYGSTFRPDIFNRRRYWKYKNDENICSCFNRRWWFTMRKRWMLVRLCALVLLYFISFIVIFINYTGNKWFN